MGLNGEVQAFGGLIICDDIINTRPNCPDGYSAMLDPIVHEPGTCRWECVRDNNGGGGDPFASTCGCRTSSNRKRPGGKMILVDTQLGDEGVRRAKVRTTKYRWGFIWSTTNTDDEGCWSTSNTYNVDRAKVQIVFKDKVSDRMVIRSLRGARVHNAFLEAVDFTWYLTRDDERWNNLCLKIEDDRQDNTSLREQTFIAATTNNAVHEYYDDHTNGAPSPGKMPILIHTMNDRLDAAPMFRKIDARQFNMLQIEHYLAFYAANATGLAVLLPYWEVAKPDVFIAFGDGKASDRYRRTVYHEMVHTSQFVRLGYRWWKENILYLGRVYTANMFGADQPEPYGDGSTPGSGRTEVIEGMAFAFGNRFAGAKYGIRHSVEGFLGLSGHDSEAETAIFWDKAGDANFIPRGLFYDLLDNNSRPFPNVTRREGRGVVDRVSGINFNQQLNALAPSITTIDDYRIAIRQPEFRGNNTLLDVDQLFDSYDR